MVDVSKKSATKRMAVASSTIILGEKAFNQLSLNGSPKGDVLETARVAALLAAKATPQMIPFCHPLELNTVSVEFKMNDKDYSIETITEVSYEGKTGVEMEALLAASVASLTIYDMMKFADKGMVIQQTRLLKKSGGKSGDFNAS